MAHMKYRNKEGRVIELDVSIYSKDDKVDVPEYSVHNGLITQNLKMDLTVGVHNLTYPIAYMHTNQGVFISDIPEEAKPKVYVSKSDLNHCEVTVLPHGMNPNTIITLTTTGY